jgi:hypothetical protein
MSQIRLELHIDEINVVLSALGTQRFDQVASLIGKIRDQAIPQIPADDAQSGTFEPALNN